jgi:ribosome-associated protein
MESNKLALLCRKLAENKKAENTVILDVRNLSSITDFFVITSGAAEPHLRAIVNEITGRLFQDHALSPRAIDGDSNSSWQVLDYFDVIVHIMRADAREKYDLEGLWGDAARLAPKRARARKPGAGKTARAKAAGKKKTKPAIIGGRAGSPLPAARR